MFVVAKYYVEADLPIEEAARAIAAEESTGTWTQIGTRGDSSGLDAVVLKAQGNLAEIGFPLELFEELNIPQYLSVVAGNLFGLEALRNVRLLDVDFPEGIVRAHGGPRFGIEDARRILGVESRPLVGTIVKPKVGLSPRETARVAYNAGLGGVDLVKDDETLTNQDFCPLEERVSGVMGSLDKVYDETGKRIFYAANVTVGASQILERAERAIEAGANMVMVDVFTAGFDALQALSREVRVPIHAHRAMHAALTRNKRHGISMLVFAKLARMAGATNLHVGSYRGKMAAEAGENDICRDALRGEWYGLKKVFPVASGGIHPGNVSYNLNGYGVDCIIQAGGGIHGHPMGTTAGALAMGQAVDAWVEGVSLEEYALTHRELSVALEHWKGIQFNYPNQ